MSKIVRVQAIVDVYITVPDHADKDHVFNFVANNISYRDAFLGVADDDSRVTDIIMVDEEVLDMDYQESSQESAQSD